LKGKRGAAGVVELINLGRAKGGCRLGHKI